MESTNPCCAGRHSHPQIPAHQSPYKPTVNLERVIIADIQAAGGMPGMTPQMNKGVGNPEPVDFSVVRRYANFILANPQLMSQTIIPASIALIESAPSMLGGRIRSPSEANPWNGPTQYYGTGRLLLDSGFTYDSVFFPDTTYSALPSPQSRDLAKYAVVVAPWAWALDDSQVNTLLTYAQNGGTLIILGSFGTSQPDGSSANRPQLSTLPQSGVMAYGAGKVVVSPQTLGVTYEIGDNPTQRQTRASFQQFMAPYAQADVEVSGVAAVVHEPGITPFLYLDNAGRNLVHLVNYDYDDSSDQFYTKTNVMVSVRVGSQPVDEVILRSPDTVGAQSLPFTRNGDRIILTVPEVDAWSVLYFNKTRMLR